MEDARFCHACGSPIASRELAEYKQVTVLFADVVRSMDIAAALGTERLREIMTELVNRATAVVQRYGGIVDKFTGDGIMALFGAPVALEDHAFRTCLAALDIQEHAKQLAVEVERRDGIELQLRIGLNSGEVIAGEIGASPRSYTAVGAEVGMAQRMESIATPGGVMLTETTARLVEDAAMLGEPKMVHIKGFDEPVRARPLLAITAPREHIGPHASTLVGREWELTALTAMFDRSIKGSGCVAGVAGPAGIGKSRIVSEIASIADNLGVEVFSTFCESHTTEIAFHVVARLLRAAFRVEGLDDEQARALVRTEVPNADAVDLVLVDDVLGIREPGVEPPDIAADARRRRLTALVNAAALARTTPRVYVVEDAHWIDQTSESLLAGFLPVIPQTHSLVLITYRPEYQGALCRTPGAQTIALAPLDDSDTSALITELLGPDPSIVGLTAPIAARAAGNPFFAEEIVRDLADRGVLTGERGAYVCPGGAIDVNAPPTLQAAIAARIDRLDTAAKRTLNAAAVIGLRFAEDLLAALIDDAALAPLIDAELIDQVKFTARAEYAFHHPLIRTVAYQSQLKSDRAELHRRLAAAVEDRDPASVDENAALIAEHFEAAGDLREAFGRHMRAGTWLTYRDIRAAMMSWRRARDIADRLPADTPDRAAMRIAPRARVCLSTWRAGGSVADTGFDELRDLATASDDKVSLAIGMSGQVWALLIHARYRESSQLASEFTSLVESIGDPTLTVALLCAAPAAKFWAGEMAEVLRLTQRIIELADGDPGKGKLILESPLAVAMTLRATARACLGEAGWKDDIEQAVAVYRAYGPSGYPVALAFKYGIGVSNGGLLTDAAALRETAEAVELAEHRADDYALAAARLVAGLALVQLDGAQPRDGFKFLGMAREAALQDRFNRAYLPQIDIEFAKEKARSGDLDGAVALLRAIVDDEFGTGEMICRGPAVAALVDLLLQRGTDADGQEAQAAIDRLAAVPTDPGFVLFELPLLRMRALLARARGDEVAYRDCADRYREMANSVGFEGHMATAAPMR